VLPAAQHLGIQAGDIDAAEAAGLLHLTATEVSFRHPLVRSAVYQSAQFSERAQVHRALARTADPDRRSWHQAAALAGPDDTVAGALEESARRARARSGFGAAVAGLQRAATLTTDPGARARRPAPAASLLRQAREFAADPNVVADIEYTQALIEMADATPADAYARLTRAAATVTATDPGRAQKLLLQAREAAYLSAEPRAEAEVSRQAADLAAAQAGDPFAAAFLDGIACWLGPDPGGAVPRLRQALDLADQSADPRRLFWAGIAAFALGDDALARRFLGQETTQARSEASIRAGQPNLAASAAASFGHWAATTRSAPDLALHARLLALLAPAHPGT
jgi:hypothetical protein